MSTIDSVKRLLLSTELLQTKIPTTQIKVLNAEVDITKELLEESLVKLKRVIKECDDRIINEEAKKVHADVEKSLEIREMLEDSHKMMLYVQSMFQSQYLRKAINDKYQEY